MRGNPISKNSLTKLYLNQKKSSQEISKILSCSPNKVNYWLNKHNIKKRTISDAIYLQQNPDGDPFRFKKPSDSKDWFLFGLGLGLYWGEGNKKNTVAVRLGNTDPYLIIKFLEFLKNIYEVDDHKIKFGLQIFSDIPPKKALEFWCKKLKVEKEKFQKVVVTPARGKGTYKNKNDTGVLTIYFGNKKLRDIINNEIEILKQVSYDSFVR